MKSKINKKNNQSEYKRFSALFLGRLKYSATLHEEFYKLKRRYSAAFVLGVSANIFNKERCLDLIHGEAFPSEINKIFSVPALYNSCLLIKEITWSICRCLQYRDQLRDFIKEREGFELAILMSSKEQCIGHLDMIESKYGKSLWLIESRLCIARNWGGLAELNSATNSFRSADGLSEITKILIWFMQRRIEGTSNFNFLKEELDKVLGKIKYPELRIYLETKLFDLGYISGRDASSVLFFEAQSSLFDLYETLVHVLQSIASDPNISDEFISELALPVSLLYKTTKDKRLRPILRFTGFSDASLNEVNALRAAIIESYTCGLYHNCLNDANAYLQIDPEDMAVMVLQHKAALHVGAEPLYVEGVLSVVSKCLTVVLSFSEGTYAAAHELFQLWGQFYGQGWIDYIRATVCYELRTEEDCFPPSCMRDVFIRDIGISPFSAITMPESASSLFMKNVNFEVVMPRTLEAYALLTQGACAVQSSISGVRKNKLLARYHLAFGDVNQAVVLYMGLKGVCFGADAIRSAGGLVLARLKQGRLEEATNELVSAYISNSFVPNTLPIEKLVEGLSSPEDWPISISLPIVFGLYNEYYGAEKLASLRYSFERYQIENNINKPEDLIDISIPNEQVIIYLKNVWHPEVMRQTIIYAGVKEVEEARIKVCQLLAKLDPENEAKYYEEIKDRVKRLAIADGLKLVEQSKVYVDIQAIKKEIVKRLDSPYKRYKNSQVAVNPSDRNLERAVEFLSETILPSLPSLELYIISGEGKEGGAQFDAMYAEVENEFLRGAHGLNAYLSTRIRHGVLSNLLRKAVEDEKLVTSKEEGKDSYIRNGAWIFWEGQDVSKQEELWSLLDRFSASFDKILDELRDNRLQIKVENGMPSTGNELALFVYSSTSAERLLLKVRDRHGKDIDQFVDKCVEYLWKKTDENLERVQSVLNDSVRHDLMLLFDDLSNAVGVLPVSVQTSSLKNAIGRAKTETQSRLLTVISWFKRSEVYDRQDYPAEFLVEVAHSMIKNTISSAASWSQLNVACVPVSTMMPGRTFDALVYVFYGVLENAIKRSKLSMHDLNVDVAIRIQDGVFNATIINNIDKNRICQEDLEKIAKAKASINSKDSLDLAQGEGLSGLNKIWLAVSGPRYSNPSIDFGIDEDKFFINIKFGMEVR